MSRPPALTVLAILALAAPASARDDEWAQGLKSPLILAAGPITVFPPRPAGATKLPVETIGITKLSDYRFAPIIGPQAASASGQLLTVFPAKERLDLTQKVLSDLEFGGKIWKDIGVAVDSYFDSVYLSFKGKGASVLRAIDPYALITTGQDIIVNDVTYHLEIDDRSHPIAKGSLVITPFKGGRPGEPVRIQIQGLADKVKSSLFHFTAAGKEYILLYASDAAAGGSGLAGTRSFVIVHPAGLFTRFWPIPESSLPKNHLIPVTLPHAFGMTRLALKRTDNTLEIYNAQ